MILDRNIEYNQSLMLNQQRIIVGLNHKSPQNLVPNKRPTKSKEVSKVQNPTVEVVNLDESYVDPSPNVIEAEDFLNAEYRNRVHLFFNPYLANPTEVKMNNFRDARIFDRTADDGFILQRAASRKEYLTWLSSQRDLDGWNNFRRTKPEQSPTYSTEHNPTIIVSPKLREKLISIQAAAKEKEDRELRTELIAGTFRNSKNSAGNNKQGRLIASSRVKGKSIYDDEFVAKVFTFKMGKKVSQTRNEMGLTQAELAMKVGVDEKTIANIERGGLVSYNSSDVLTRSLAKALNLPTIKYEE